MNTPVAAPNPRTHRGSTASPGTSATTAQPATLNKAARNHNFIASLTIPASAQPTNSEQTLAYSDLAAVEHALAQATSDWTPPSPDLSIPTAAAERRAWASRVNAAIKNTRGDIQGKLYKLWAEDSDIDSTLSPEALEYISYKIVVSFLLPAIKSGDQNADTHRTSLNACTLTAPPPCISSSPRCFGTSRRHATGRSNSAWSKSSSLSFSGGAAVRLSFWATGLRSVLLCHFKR